MNTEGLQLENGDVYIGETQNGYPHGMGIKVCSDGTLYYAQWKHGQPTVARIVYTRDAASVSNYIGELSDRGDRHGYGSRRYATGVVYVGLWKNDKRHGPGCEVIGEIHKYGLWHEDVLIEYLDNTAICYAVIAEYKRRVDTLLKYDFSRLQNRTACVLFRSSKQCKANIDKLAHITSGYVCGKLNMQQAAALTQYRVPDITNLTHEILTGAEYTRDQTSQLLTSKQLAAANACAPHSMLHGLVAESPDSYNASRDTEHKVPDVPDDTEHKVPDVQSDDALDQINPSYDMDDGPASAEHKSPDASNEREPSDVNISGSDSGITLDNWDSDRQAEQRNWDADQPDADQPDADATLDDSGIITPDVIQIGANGVDISGLGIYSNGALLHGLPHGVGKLLAYDGTVYIGNFHHGKKNGNGMITYVNQNTYSGEWQNDVQNGNGVMTRVDGYRYTGNWVNGKRSGTGTVSRGQARPVCTGEWIADRPPQYGTLNYPSGDVYEGQLQPYDVPHGNGSITYCDGTTYSGNWENGLPHGWGTMRDTQGGKYTGHWQHGICHGWGFEYDSNGIMTKTGEWVDGQYKQPIPTRKR